MNDISLVLRFEKGQFFYGKNAKIIINDKERVNGGTNYDSPGQRWVPKLVYVYNKGITVT